MSIESRLLKRKKWYTLDDAARRLSVEFGCDISHRDLAQFALDGELKLSVLFQDRTFVHGYRLVPSSFHLPCHTGSIEGGTYIPSLLGYQIDWCDQVAWVSGTCRLVTEHHVIRKYLRTWVQYGAGQFTESEYVDKEWFVESAHDGQIYFMVDVASEDADGHDTYCVNERLPKPEDLIVTKPDLDVFVNRVLEEGESSQSKREPDEMKTLEVLGLLTEALAQQHPGLYAISGKPKRSGIVSIMLGVVEGYAKPADTDAEPLELRAVGKTTLDNILRDSIEAWERRKQQ
ncbi:hypothetical protein ACOJCM_14675 [Billgrantia sp. LNSP4103-1]|uniref:hypothetical protein n=1 Tax=Billgrantia sp. LNSP4103-1 TaxID=3410266 RepID=UPI00403F4A34